MSFRMSFYLMPKVELPDDYLSAVQSVEKPDENITASDEDVASVVTDIRRSMYAEAHPDKPAPAEGDPLPELTDAYVQKISGRHTDTESFLRDVRNNITEEKQTRERSVFRKKMLDAILAKTTVSVPAVVIDEDAKRMYEDFQERAVQFGTTVEDYLKAHNLSEEDLHRQMREDAKNRAVTQFLVNAISAKEHIHAKEEDVERNMAEMKKRDSNADDERLRVYIESLLTHEAVLRFFGGAARMRLFVCKRVPHVAAEPHTRMSFPTTTAVGCRPASV